MTIYALDRISTSSSGGQGDGDSLGDAFSPDGTKFLFVSAADNLVPGDTNGVIDLFLKDLVTGAVTRISTDSAGAQVGAAPNVGAFGGAVFSSDATKVLFSSDESGLAAGAPANVFQVYVKDLATGAVTLASTSATGQFGNADSFYATYDTATGRVLFTSFADNLVSGDTNNGYDLFLKDLTTGAITRVSTTSSGGQRIGDSGPGAFLPGGTRIVFEGTTSVNGTPTSYDIYLKDLATGSLTVLSHDVLGNPGNSPSYNFAVSADGSKIAFESFASNLVSGDTNGRQDVFVEDLATRAITRVSTTASGAQSAGSTLTFMEFLGFSPDGTLLSFASNAPDLVPGDTNGADDVFIKNLVTGAIQRISTTSSGAQTGGAGSGFFSPDGNHVAFVSNLGDLVQNDTNGAYDVFIATLNAPPTTTAPPAPPVTTPPAAASLATQAGRLTLAGNDVAPPATTIAGPSGTTIANPLYQQLQAEQAIAADLAAGHISAQDAQSALFHLVDGTVSVANIAYAFFTGATPTAAGLSYLVHSPGNPNDLNDGYYAGLNTDNRYINFAINLATGVGAGGQTFLAGYGGLSLAQATAKAYAAVFGGAIATGVTPDSAKVDAILNTLVPDGVGGQETRAKYFLDLAGGDTQGQKAAVIGFLLADSVKEGFGTYATAEQHFLADLAAGHPAYNVDLVGVYG